MIPISSVHNLVGNAFWSFRRAWATDTRLLAFIIVASIAQSLTPAGFAIAARGVVNATVELLEGVAERDALLFWLGVGLALAILDALSKSTNELCTARLEDELDLSITSGILDKAAELELSYFEDPRRQDQMERASQNTAKTFIKSTKSATAAVSGGIQAVSLLVVLIAIDRTIVVLMLPVAIPYLVVQWKLSKLRFRLEHARATQRRWTKYFTRLLSSHESVPEVKVLGLGPLLTKRFRDLMRGFKDENRRVHLQKFAADAVFVLLATVGAYYVFFRVATGVSAGTHTVGDVAIFGGAALRLTGAIETTIKSLATLLERTQHISNLREFLAIEVDAAPDAGLAPATCEGHVEFRNVSFAYPGAVEQALTDVSIEIRAGETVALVGENGSGKTTLAKLLLRLYEPSAGEIRLDGRDLQSLSQEFLHEHVSMVFQDFARYEATAAENIAFGAWKRLCDDASAIAEAAERGGVDQLVQSMPQGYDTMLGRTFGEYSLSGGQWQQIALARALAREAPVVVLDEPTAHIDTPTAVKTLRRFKQVASGRTTLLISHRFSTVGIADRIVVLRRGRVIEQGTHDELVRAGGHYAELYDAHQE